MEIFWRRRRRRRRSRRRRKRGRRSRRGRRRRTRGRRRITRGRIIRRREWRRKELDEGERDTWKEEEEEERKGKKEQSGQTKGIRKTILPPLPVSLSPVESVFRCASFPAQVQYPARFKLLLGAGGPAWRVRRRKARTVPGAIPSWFCIFWESKDKGPALFGWV